MVCTNPKSQANMFDNIPALAPPKPSAASNELDQYLNTDVKHVTDTLAWWYDYHNTYPHLSHMVLDYLTIPGMFFFSFFSLKL